MFREVASPLQHRDQISEDFAIHILPSQPIFTCSKTTKETPVQNVNFVQS